MSPQVDLSELAIDPDRRAGSAINSRRHLLTRYVLPTTLMAGFVTLVAWASRDLLFPPRTVSVVPVYSTRVAVESKGARLFQAAGWVEPRPTPIRVAALAPGVVEKLLVVEDQPVQQGQPIAALVKADAELAHEAALADLELRQAELDEAKAAFAAAQVRFDQPVHLEAELGDAEASLAKVRTQLKNVPFALRRAEANRDATTNEYESKQSARGVVAGVAIKIARSKAEAAEALVLELHDRSDSLESEHAALVSRRDALKTRLALLADETRAKDEAQARIKAAKARVTQAQVAVAQAKLRLDRMTVVAPIDGRVFRLIAHPGARIGSGMTHMVGHDGSTVVTMYRPDMLQVRVDARFEDIPKVNLNQPVKIDNPALTKPLIGQVLFISSEADIQKNTLQVKVKIDDPPSILKPEMLVDVTFLAPATSQKQDAPSDRFKLYTFEQLIHQDARGSYVWLADQSEGVAHKTRVELGAIRSGNLVEVVSGLTISSRIISGGAQDLTDGARIEVTREDPSLGIKATTGFDQARGQVRSPQTAM